MEGNTIEERDDFDKQLTPTNSNVSDDDDWESRSEYSSIGSFTLGSTSSSRRGSKEGSPVIRPITKEEGEERWKKLDKFRKEKIGPPPPTPTAAHRAAWGLLDNPPPPFVPPPGSDALPPELTVFGEEDDAPAYYDFGTAGNVGTTENDEDWKTTEWVANWEGEDAPGRMIVERDIKGKAIYGWDEYGYPIYGYDENDEPIYIYDESKC